MDITDTVWFISCLPYISKWTVRAGWKRNFMTKEIISIFPLWTLYLFVATFQQHLYMEYISLSWSDIPKFVVHIHDFLDRGFLHPLKLLNQGHLVVMLKSSLLKFYRCGLCHKWQQICSICSNHNPFRSTFMTYHQVCKKSNTMGATSGVGTAYTSGAHEFISDS